MSKYYSTFGHLKVGQSLKNQYLTRLERVYYGWASCNGAGQHWNSFIERTILVASDLARWKRFVPGP